MEENSPAPAVNTESEAITNPTPAPEAPAETETPAGSTLTLTDEQKRFIDSNGGFDKLFGKMKSMISNPPVQKVEPAPAPQPQVQPQPQAEARDGYMTPRQIAAIEYRNILASDPKYANIKDHINQGDFIKSMTDMGMTPVDENGNFNDRAIRQYLDLKSASMPAVAPEAPQTPTPTATYTSTQNGEFTSVEEAERIATEPNNPEHDKAIEYLRKTLFNKK